MFLVSDKEPRAICASFAAFLFVVIIAPILLLELNKLRLLYEIVQEKLGNIAAALKKRQTLVSDLWEVVRSYDTHEASVHVRVAEAGSGAAAMLKIQSLLDQTVRQIVALEQRFPDLKSNDHY